MVRSGLLVVFTEAVEGGDVVKTWKINLHAKKSTTESTYLEGQNRCCEYRGWTMERQIVDREEMSAIWDNTRADGGWRPIGPTYMKMIGVVMSIEWWFCECKNTMEHAVFTFTRLNSDWHVHKDYEAKNGKKYNIDNRNSKPHPRMPKRRFRKRW